MADTAVLYYSFTGKTEALAKKKARKLQADLIALTEAKKRSTPGAYLFGSLAAMTGRKEKLSAPLPELCAYTHILILVPLWAGCPAPAFQNILAVLPPDKEVEVIITSASGNSGNCKQKVKALIEAKGCRVRSCRDVRAAEIS